MNKILFLAFLIISSLALSACTNQDPQNTNVFDKTPEEQVVTEEKVEDLTDEQLLQDLESDNTSLDADLKALETDLQ